MCGAEDCDSLQPFVATNAMFSMHHEVAGVKRAELKLELRSLAAFAGRAYQTVTQNILLGDQCEIRRNKAMFEAKNYKRDQLDIELAQLIPIFRRAKCRHAMCSQQLCDTFRRALTVTGD